MPRVKRFIDVDVLTEARKRMHHVYDIFDTVVVMFSGGKDSMAALELTWQVAQERGLGHVDVVFRDEELIPDSVLDKVDEYRLKPWVRLLWFAVPLASTEYIMGVSRQYVQWDPGRAWVRQKPSWAIVPAEGDARIFDQYSMDARVAEHYRGKLAFVTGIRASESLIRFRASVNKLSENYITAPTTYGHAPSPKNVMLVKPLFDWEENDIFKFFMDHGLSYCALYDAQLWAGAGLRVSTPLHAEAAKRFHMLKVFAPTLYAQVIAVFPEMLAHERLYPELDRARIVEKYSGSLSDVRRWVIDSLDDPEQQALALKRLDAVDVRATRNPALYPPAYVLKAVMAGAYKREILPLKVAK